MGVLGALVRTAHDYPALLPLILAASAAALWAYRRRRWGLMGTAVTLGAIATLFYTGTAPAAALGRARTAQDAALLPAPRDAAPPKNPGLGLEDTEFSSTTRLHPRFPGDFPLPRIFRLEYTYGGLRHGAVTVRFRFQGDPVDAVHDLIEAGRSAGWSTDIKAPHRVSFHKSGRTIDAWFGFPGHALVLDLPEPR